MPSARNVAVKLLLRVEKGAYSNIILDNERSFSDLSDTDKKFTSRLFYGTIERKITLDYIISSYLSKPISKLDKEILMILRTGVYQLLYMPSVPDNAAVNESVKLATEFSKSSAKGMVNAILRNFIRNDKTFSLPKDEISSLSVKYSVPSELISKWIKDYGKEETEKILEGFSSDENNITMRVNNTLISDDDFISEMKSMGIECIKSEILPHCVITSSFSGIENNPLYKKGYFHVQDIASQLCAKALGAKRGETVLDVCSAPGGKTFTIAEIMENNGEIFAFDLHENRVKLIKNGAERLSLTSVKAKVSDATVFDETIPTADKILCDVVCAGFGVISKKPEIKYKPLKETERLPEIQLKILQNASKYLKVGGELVYSTCSLSKDENDNVIDKFLENNKDFEGVPVLAEMGKPFGDYKATIFPYHFGGDGFFIAKIRRVR